MKNGFAMAQKSLHWKTWEIFPAEKEADEFGNPQNNWINYTHQS